jgi:putative endonuclease
MPAAAVANSISSRSMGRCWWSWKCARARGRFAQAAESVDLRKQARIVQATQVWLLQHPAHAGRAVRFDVIGFDGDAPPQWWRAAFTADGA